MNTINMVTDKMLKDLGFDVKKQDTNEFKPFENIIQMPMTAFRMSSKALDTHLSNLLNTYGEEAVIDMLIKKLVKK